MEVGSIQIDVGVATLLQGLLPNHLVLLCSKDVVVSDGETADWIRQVCDEKVSASEPLMTRRYPFQTLPKREAAQISWNSVDRACLWATRQPAYRRHELNCCAEDLGLRRP